MFEIQRKKPEVNNSWIKFYIVLLHNGKYQTFIWKIGYLDIQKSEWLHFVGQQNRLDGGLRGRKPENQMKKQSSELSQSVIYLNERYTPF